MPKCKWKDIQVIDLPTHIPSKEEREAIKKGEKAYHASPEDDNRIPIQVTVPGMVSPELIDSYRAREHLSGKEIRQVIAFFKDRCIKCGETYLAALDFHHREPKDKLFGISQFYRLQSKIYPTCGGLSPMALFDEIDKCDVLCSNCHRKESHSDRRDLYMRSSF